MGKEGEVGGAGGDWGGYERFGGVDEMGVSSLSGYLDGNEASMIFGERMCES